MCKDQEILDIQSIYAIANAPTQPQPNTTMNDIIITFIEQQKDIHNSFVHFLKKLDKTMQKNTELHEKLAEKLSVLIPTMQENTKLREKSMKKLSDSIPMEINICNSTKLKLKGLRQHYINLREDEKNRKLIDLLAKLKFNQGVIFLKSASRCAALCNLLNKNGFPAAEFHNIMSAGERLEHYKDFKECKTRILVATNLFDMDVAHINIVFNFDIPKDADTYLDRVDRFDSKGLIITYLASRSDAEILNEVQNRFKVQINEMPDEIDVATYIENH